jgi:hypothetical protein
MTLVWERIIDNIGSQLLRAPVFGGWLVKDRTGGLTFVADPNLSWDVETRPPLPPEPPRVVAAPPMATAQES